jgi:putative FmdB family regulatory protein
VPVYEYRCKACAHQFDIHQSFSDDALTECPNCHEPQLRKVFAAVGIAFKGSGFYKNDHGSRAGGPSSSTPAAGSGSGEGSSSSGSSDSGSSSDSGGSSSTPAVPSTPPASSTGTTKSSSSSD